MDNISIIIDNEPIGSYFMDIEITGKVITVDYGIGHYEFWGSAGYHTDERCDIDGKLEMSITQIWDEDDNPINQITPEILKLATEWLNSNDEKIKTKMLEHHEE